MPRTLLFDQPAPASSGPLQVTERPLLSPGPHQLVVAVGACGVCRTDLQLVEGDLPAHRRPVVPGHQVVGRVTAAGAEARHQVGDRVGITWLGGACGSCSYCRTDRENLCDQASFHGWDHDGGYADEMLVDDDFAVAITSDRPDAEIAPLLCAGVIGHRALRATAIETGEHLGLYGFGSSAALVLQLAIGRGLDVHVATRNQAEQQRAQHLGATSVSGYQDQPPVPLQAAITFAPVGSVVIDALRAVDKGGRVIINAIHLDQIPAFDYDLLWHERSIASVANVTRTDIAELLAADAERPLQIDHRIYPLVDANHALADLARGATGGPAVLVP
ncbi:MAG: zinc-binding alcohol dehydrogenase family protein [Acidimicrobiales bacterium]